MIEMTGKVFGNLTVIECAGKPQGKKTFHWKCKCSCGKEVIVDGAALRSGNTKSCGCLRSFGLKKYNAEQSEKSKIPIGTRFGKLVVIEDLGFIPHVEGHKRRGYLCQCDCGNLKQANSNQLKTGNLLSCGRCELKSKGEMFIQKILDKGNYFYNYDCIYEELLQESGRRLRFDFIIYEDKEKKIPKLFLEYDGRQHFDGPDTDYWGRSTDTLESIKEKDKIKNDFCLSHNFPLVRIPYWKEKITEEDIFGEKYLIKRSDEE